MLECKLTSLCVCPVQDIYRRRTRMACLVLAHDQRGLQIHRLLEGEQRRTRLHGPQAQRAGALHGRRTTDAGCAIRALIDPALYAR